MLNCLGSDDLQALFLHQRFLPRVMNGSRKRSWGRKLQKQQVSVGQQCRGCAWFCQCPAKLLLFQRKECVRRAESGQDINLHGVYIMFRTAARDVFCGPPQVCPDVLVCSVVMVQHFLTALLL